MPEDKDSLEKAIEDLNETNKGSDVDMIEKAINDLNSTWQGLSEKLYKQSKADSGTSASDEPANTNKDKDSEVEEADFEEVK